MPGTEYAEAGEGSCFGCQSVLPRPTLRQTAAHPWLCAVWSDSFPGSWAWTARELLEEYHLRNIQAWSGRGVVRGLLPLLHA